MRFIRYALATFCFAASVGCLAMWLSKAYVDCCLSAYAYSVDCEVNSGSAFFVAYDEPRNWRLTFAKTSPYPWWEDIYGDGRLFGWGWFLDYYPSVYFPIWSASLIFALAGVGILRFRRQFSIRSAMVVTTVVAALIGMAIVL